MKVQHTSSGNLAILVFIISLLLTHTLLINFPPVNLEFTFVGAAEYFKGHNSLLLDQYFYYQANTLGMPFLVSKMTILFPFIDSLILFRFLNLFGIILLALGVFNFLKDFDYSNKIVYFLLLFLNPLVWSFSERATADFFPMALGVYAISLFLGTKKTLPKALVGSVLFGIAVVLKYHVILFLIYLASISLYYKNNMTLRKNSLLCIFICILIVTIFLVYCKNTYGFWITPAKYQQQHRFLLSDVLNNFILYIGFLLLLVLPTSIFSGQLRVVIAKSWKLLIGIFSILFFCALGLFHNSGELNFGPIDNFIPYPIRMLILSSMGVLMLSILTIKNREDIPNKRLLIYLKYALFFVLLSLSFTRPSQRYLLFVLPFFIFVFPTSLIRSKAIVISSIFVFILTDCYIEYSRWCVGKASQIMVEKLKEDGLLLTTLPGAIEAHVGNVFYQTARIPQPKAEYKFNIVSGKVEDAIFVSSAGFDIIPKYYSLIAIPAPK